tara:strand:- start:244 stop:357 length:114 start_codon:yes stop_codon:yes gene_type:complete
MKILIKTFLIFFILVNIGCGKKASLDEYQEFKDFKNE